MKVIDLLNKIANGEHPKKFKLHIYKEDFIYELSDNGGYYEINTEEEFTESINLIFCLNDEVEIIEDTPKEDKTNYKDLLQQEIYNENKILLSILESDTKLDMIKKYITSEEAIDIFKSIESRNEWLEVHDKILDIIENFKLQNESGEIIEDTPKENKKLDRIDKAIEYIESYNLPKDLGNLSECPISVGELKELLKILKGEVNVN